MSRASHGLTIRPWLLSLVITVVCVCWAVNLAAGWLGWQSDGGVNAIMGALLALIGTIYGKSLLTRPDEDEEPEQEPRPPAGRHRRPDGPRVPDRRPQDQLEAEVSTDDG